MPRDGLSQYAPPPGTNGITNYTIESTKYNGFVADVTQDLNLPRPIVAGGTGANNAHDAMIALSGEIAYQVVTNYDTFPFVSGSFKSAAGATAAPTPTGFFVGYVADYNGNSMVIVAHDGVTGIAYKRTKSFTDGTWGAWTRQAGSTADLDAAYVNVTGDTMTGPLTVAGGVGVGLGLAVQGASFPTTGVGIEVVYSAGAGRIQVYDRDGGTGFKPLVIDGGTNLSVAVTTASTSPTTGALTVAGGVGISGKLYVGSGGVASFGEFTSAVTSTSGAYYFGSGGTKVLNYDGTNFIFAGANLSCSRVLGTGFVSRQGETGPANLVDVHNHYWTGVAALFINNTNVGTITLTSDYRIKKDVIDLPGMWDTVKALRPIKYTHKDYTPQNEKERRVEMVAAAVKEGMDVPYAKEGYVIPPFVPGDSIERWGFIAHELQETLTPSVASGVKDDPDAIQALNIDGVVAALTKALQEAMARIEALEGGAARR